ncbi:flavin monoamine oxidase family protein [Uliginosibacterium sediminicola]|uniref:FAD-dependent oxidoreductase n=1 Tax=Uliginosibacterium sediminicola TaxID=2024550 RepID=A0ABU9Z2I2_9RHOO
MLDTLVVGAGLCGLSLASKLQFAGRDYLLVEARTRLGGRIETFRSASGQALDLGPGWFWPETQPRITRLLSDLGLSSFAQHDSGTNLHLASGDGSPEALQQRGVHNGAQRVTGGMRTLVDALAQRLAVERMRMGYELTRLVDHGDFIEAHCWTGAETVVLSARHVVLAMPPRLVDERIAFVPALAAGLTETLRATPTWMSAQAKALAAFDSAFWRDAGLSGNAFVTHAQAVLGEIFDASPVAGEGGALGGFFCLPPSVRKAYKAVLPMMASSQFAQLYGPAAADDAELHLRDWADEGFTCSALDAAGRNEHPEDAVAALAEPYWDGKLHLAGSETASLGAGYLEGALDAAARVWQQLAGERPLGDKVLTIMHTSNNEQCLNQFATWVAAQREAAIAAYKQGLTRALSTQQYEQITQRVVIDVVEKLYATALQQLAGLPFETREVAVEKGRSALTPALLQSFVGFSDALLTAAVTHNATSCAISNFPAEHDPDAEYLQGIRRDLAAAWREFALAVNERMLSDTAFSAPALKTALS